MSEWLIVGGSIPPRSIAPPAPSLSSNLMSNIPGLPDDAAHTISLPLSPLSDKQLHIFYQPMNDVYFLVTGTNTINLIGSLTGQQLFQLYRTISPSVEQLVADKDRRLEQMRELVVGAEQATKELSQEIADKEDTIGDLNEKITQLVAQNDAKDRLIDTFKQGMQTMEAVFTLIYNAARV